MEKSAKIVLGIGIAIVTIAGGSLLYYYVIKPKFDANKIPAKRTPGTHLATNTNKATTGTGKAVGGRTSTPKADTVKATMESKESSDVVVAQNEHNDFSAAYRNLIKRLDATGYKAAYKIIPDNNALSIKFSNGNYMANFFPDGRLLLVSRDGVKSPAKYSMGLDGDVLIVTTPTKTSSNGDVIKALNNILIL